jgi:hypothetical protein
MTIERDCASFPEGVADPTAEPRGFSAMTTPNAYRRFWPILALALAIFVALMVHLAVNYFTREQPNYSRIEDGLWLGGFVTQPPPGSKDVLNLCESEDPYRAETHRWEPIRDAEPVPSLDWLCQQVDFIEAERTSEHVVYVHCRNGASRSAMVLAAYLMRREKWSSTQALDFLRSRRSEVNPNPAFRQLLSEWERSLKE